LRIPEEERALLDRLGAIRLTCEDPVTNCELIPDRRQVILLIKDLQSLMFPAYFRVSESHAREEGSAYGWAKRELTSLIGLSLRFSAVGEERSPEALAGALLSRLPEIKELLCGDAQAIYEGDPAARSCEEVIICYPGFYAISIHRLAHALYELGIPLLPRIMSEFAHEKTGIDIHPGASIGRRFCIDHGTGIVIGETTTIGDRVRLYQGVTLGALSLSKDECPLLRDTKRHPTIEDDVIIYANATILGGQTVIGARSTIGGNVWLTESVPPDTSVFLKKPELVMKNK